MQTYRRMAAKADRGKSSNTHSVGRGLKVLACAASNVAVDNILDALLREKIDRSMNILRLNSPQSTTVVVRVHVES